jgi:hydroxymethylpyrimidine/phosphomethylpyrimidine kinase
MLIDRPIVLSIAGFDPSAGAGLLADIKTFEQHKVYGLGISTAQTLQTESEFLSIRWEKLQDIVSAIEKMLMHYEVRAIKIGIVEGLSSLDKIVSTIYSINRDVKIIIDPIVASSTGFTFWKDEANERTLETILSKVYLLTPNYNEVTALSSGDAKESAKELSRYCNVLLKGGHNMEEPAIDHLFVKGEAERIVPDGVIVHRKHGSGCILSSAITANLALGFDLITSCRLAKNYIERFLNSNDSLLGYHNV